MITEAKETFELLRDYALTTDNYWLKNKLDLLASEMRIDIINAKIETLNKL